MARKSTSGSAPDFREFISENNQRVYDFCYYMLGGGRIAEETVMAIFKEFNLKFRWLASRRKVTWDSGEASIMLFQTAWKKIGEMLEQLQYSSLEPGRDTRNFKRWDEDLLALWKDGSDEKGDYSDLVVERLALVEADFRVPVVLRDILHLSDDEVIRILGIRWGVYRHRLHRGRLEAKESFRGRSVQRSLSDSPV